MNSNSTKISIIMPLHNKVNYIQDAINSVISQNYYEWELIVVDDGSNDGSGDLVRSIAKSNSRIKYYYQINQDQLRAISLGLDNACGEIITILHADDILVANSLGGLYKQLSMSNSDGLYASYILIDELGNVVENEKSTLPKYNPTTEAIKCLINFGSNGIGDHFFVKRSAVDQIKKNYLTNNLIYYFNYQDISKSLILEQTKAWYKYRVFAGNYANSEVGSFVLFTGQIRTVYFLTNLINVREILVNRYFFKLIREMELFLGCTVTNNTSDSVLLKYYKQMKTALRNNHVATSLINNVIFSINAKLGNITIPKVLVLTVIEEQLCPADARYIYNNLLKNSNDSLYYKLFYEQYTHIECKQEHYADVKSVLSFYSLYTPIRIKEDLNAH